MDEMTQEEWKNHIRSIIIQNKGIKEIDEEYQNKLVMAKFAYLQLTHMMEAIKKCSPYKIDFCWDEYMIVGEEGFNYEEMQAEGVEPSLL